MQMQHIQHTPMTSSEGWQASIDINSYVQPIIEQLSIKTLKMVYANN